MGTDEVVELLGLSAATVRRLVKDGHLSAHRPPGGRKWLFRADEVLGAVRSWAAEYDDVMVEAPADARPAGSAGERDLAAIWCAAPPRLPDESHWLDQCFAAWCDAARRAGLDPRRVGASGVEVNGLLYELHVAPRERVRVVNDDGEDDLQLIETVWVTPRSTPSFRAESRST